MSSRDFTLDPGIYILKIDENEKLENISQIEKEFVYGFEWDKEKNKWQCIKFPNKDVINDRNNLEEEPDE